MLVEEPEYLDPEPQEEVEVAVGDDTFMFPEGFAVLDLASAPDDVTKHRKMEGKIFDSEDQEICLEGIEDLEEMKDEAYCTHFTKNKWWAWVWFDGTTWFELVRECGKPVGFYSATSPEALYKGVHMLHQS